MNKYERRLKGKFKFKKRLRNFMHDITGDIRNATFHSLKSTGTPCSCAMCSPGRVEEKAKYRLNRFNKHKIMMYEQND